MNRKRSSSGSREARWLISGEMQKQCRWWARASVSKDWYSSETTVIYLFAGVFSQGPSDRWMSLRRLIWSGFARYACCSRWSGRSCMQLCSSCGSVVVVSARHSTSWSEALSGAAVVKIRGPLDWSCRDRAGIKARLCLQARGGNVTLPGHFVISKKSRGMPRTRPCTRLKLGKCLRTVTSQASGKMNSPVPVVWSLCIVCHLSSGYAPFHTWQAVLRRCASSAVVEVSLCTCCGAFFDWQCLLW